VNLAGRRHVIRRLDRPSRTRSPADRPGRVRPETNYRSRSSSSRWDC
jgi:hypothetical protein